MKNFKMLRFVTTVSFGISLACTPNIFAMRQGNTLDTPLKQCEALTGLKAGASGFTS